MWKKRKGQAKKTFAQTISQSLELPLEVLEGMPELELRGNQEAVVTHCRGILEYNEQVVRIAGDRMTIKFTGRNLQLTCMTEESVVITGYIMQLLFSQT